MEVVVVPEVVVSEGVIGAPVATCAVATGYPKGIAFGFFVILFGQNVWGMNARVL